MQMVRINFEFVHLEKSGGSPPPSKTTTTTNYIHTHTQHLATFEVVDSYTEGIGQPQENKYM